MATGDFSSQYQRNIFDSKSYLEKYYSNPQRYRAFWHILHKFFKDKFHDRQSDLKILDYGSGPTVAKSISACHVLPNIWGHGETKENSKTHNGF